MTKIISFTLLFCLCCTLAEAGQTTRHKHKGKHKHSHKSHVKTVQRTTSATSEVCDCGCGKAGCRCGK